MRAEQRRGDLEFILRQSDPADRNSPLASRLSTITSKLIGAAINSGWRAESTMVASDGGANVEL